MTTTDLIEILINALLLPLIAWGLSKLTSYLDSQTTNATFERYVKMAEDAVTTAVQETMQTFVLTVKKEGTWTEATAKLALKSATDRAKQIMGSTVLTFLPVVVGDVEAWITSKIEAATLLTKAEIDLSVSTSIIGGTGNTGSDTSGSYIVGPGDNESKNRG
jgi:hypothetical protein